MRTRDENKEEAIRQQAIRMIATEGLDGFSVNKLARAAGVSPATLYIYYHDRDDLIIKLCSEVSARMLEWSLKDFRPDMTFEEGLRIQWINRAAYFMQYPQEVQFIEHVRYSHHYQKVAQLITKRFGEVLGPFMHNAIARQELRPLPFEVYWSVAFAPLYQLIKFHTQGYSMTNEKFALTHEVMMQTLQLVLKALKP
jgi:AcrR family transcriptional regulator